MFTAYKSVKQSYSPSPDVLEMLEIFSKMVNDCIRIGLQNNISTMKRLCQLSYKKTGKYHIVNYYRLCAISKAAGILANRKKSIMRGHSTKEPYQNKPILISCYGFKLQNGILKIPLGNRQYFDIQLNDYVRSILSSDLTAKIRSFTLTPTTISICYARKVKEIKYSTTIGIDRNLKNLTVGNRQNITQYNLSKVVQITEDTRSVVRSFKRNDVRIRKKIVTKYGQRRRNRINQLLHKVSKIVVQQAKQDKTALVFEDIRRIRGLYLRGNGQGRDHRAKMNSWPFHELKYQIEYKAVWEGVSVIQLSKGETRGTSKLCPQCGKRTQEATYGDREHYRQLWCENCKRWLDRDIVAAMNIAYKGRAFLSNGGTGKGVFERPQGAAGEAMVQESGSKEPVILKVDAAKLNPKRALGIAILTPKGSTEPKFTFASPFLLNL